jgi:DNA-binding GntR family transcriptional regulator
LASLLADWRTASPAYGALARAIAVALLDGRLPLGCRLPSERDLAGALDVSRTTVTAAYDALQASGHLLSRRGSGSWTVLPAGARRAPRVGRPRR